MTMHCQTSSLLGEQKLLSNVSCGFDDESKSPSSSISVAGITRCINQIDYLSNLKANNDVIIRSLEKKVQFDIDEEKYVHYSNKTDLFFFFLFNLSASSGYICIINALSNDQIARITKWWIIINFNILDCITNLAVQKQILYPQFLFIFFIK